MKNLFRFDVTLQELLHLGDLAKNFSRLRVLFSLLDHWWYDLSDKKRSEERRKNIRIGSVNVFLDDDGGLHLDFITRFGFKDEPGAVELLENLSKLNGDEDDVTSYIKIQE
jgi:hypothetical protein